MKCFKCFKENNSQVCPHCGFNLKEYERQRGSHILPAGVIIDNKYLVGAVLGEGGFGITYVGYHTKLDRKLAIKEYFPSGASYRKINDPSNTKSYTVEPSKDSFKHGYNAGLRNMEKEAKILASLHLPGIVNIHDFFEENRTAYLVMDFVEGVDIRSHIKRTGYPFSDAVTFTLIRPMISALSQVHAAGIVHRDISPDNIMIDAAGNATLIDFGAARVVDTDNEKSMTIILKHGYAPLEQYDTHGSQGPWTDVYSLCATMVYMLTGKKPYSIVSGTPEKSNAELIDSINFQTYPGMKEALIRGLKVRKEDRIQSMDELLEVMMGKGDDESGKTEYVPPKPSEDDKTQYDPPKPSKFDKRKRSPLPFVIGGAATVVLAASIFFIGGGGNRNPEPTPIPEPASTTGAQLSKAEVGDIITFGTYEQDNDTSNGPEAIEWRVLDKKDSRILVISEYGLDDQPYNMEYADVTWEICTLRAWLNDTFYNSAFSLDEQSFIIETTVAADKNPDYSTNPGNDTQDKIFLLSIQDTDKYFASNLERQCVPTAYAKASGLYTMCDYIADIGDDAWDDKLKSMDEDSRNDSITARNDDTCWWWLRSPGYDNTYAIFVCRDGSTSWPSSSKGGYVFSNLNAVRPSMWLNLNTSN